MRSMGGSVRLVCVVGLLAVFLTAATARAQGKRKGRPRPTAVTVTGDVAVETGEEEKVTSIKITTEKKEVYSVMVNRRSKGLAKLNGKKVEVKGRVRERKGVKWLYVARFKEIKPKAEEGAKPEGGEGGKKAEGGGGDK